MKTKALVISVMAACLTSGAAFAQSYDYYGDRSDRYERPQRYERDARYDRDDGRDGYRDGYREERGYRHHMRGAGPYHDIDRGDRLPPAFWGRENLVRDWYRYRLAEPMRGHNWMRVGDDFAMVSVSTGIVSRVALRR